MRKFLTIGSVAFNVLFVGLMATGAFLYFYENENEAVAERSLTAKEDFKVERDPEVKQMKTKVRQLSTEFDSLSRNWRKLVKNKCPKYMVLWPKYKSSSNEKLSYNQKSRADGLRKKWNSFNAERRRLSHVIEYLTDKKGASRLKAESDSLLAEVKSLYEELIQALNGRSEAAREFSQILETCA